MKMNIIIIILIFAFSFAQGQTRPKQNNSKHKPTLEETINWIVEKLNGSNGLYQTCYEGKAAFTDANYNVSSDIGNKQIIVTYSELFNTSVGTTVWKKSASIPIASISKIEYHNEKICADIENSTNNEYIKLNTYGKEISKGSSEMNGKEILEGSSKSNYLIIPIDISLENNLLNRLQKAFADLKSYFPKKQETY